MKSVSLKAYPRTQRKRTGVRKVRANQRIPAVIYGRHNPPQNLEIGLKELDDVIHHSASENILLDLAVDGDSKPNRLALIQQVQHHALSGKILHVDLHEIVETEKVTVTVPVESVGEAVGVKVGGGTLEHVLFNVKVRCLPKDLPEKIDVDVSSLEIGKSIHIGEIKAPEGVEILGDKKIVVLSVAAALTAAETEETPATATAAAPGAATAQPEMIKEKKDAAGAPAAGDKGKAAPAADKGKKK